MSVSTDVRQTDSISCGPVGVTHPNYTIVHDKYSATRHDFFHPPYELDSLVAGMSAEGDDHTGDCVANRERVRRGSSCLCGMRQKQETRAVRR